MHDLTDISTVKYSQDGYLVNGEYFVPDNPLNRHWELIQKWMAAGNTPDPEFTQEELDEITYQDTLDTEIEADINLAKAEPDIVSLIGARPNQIENYINNNVTDLNSAKSVLILLAKVTSLLARRTING